MLNGEFEKLLVEAIDESLSSLGDSPKQSILFHLENTFKIILLFVLLFCCAVARTYKRSYLPQELRLIFVKTRLPQ